MSNSSARDQTAVASALNSRISDLENHYAELFLEGSNPELLKSIHFQLEALKQELRRMER